MFDSSKEETVVSGRRTAVFVFCCCIVSFGVLLVTGGGSWDITNHLLNKPETFFSPPHTMMYLGVAISLVGVALGFFVWNKSLYGSGYKSSVKVMVVGVFLLVGAGPFDYLWHLNFGLDGLLSPSHMTLILGMVLTSFGSFYGIARFVSSHRERRIFQFVIPIAVLPVWLSLSGMISSLSLPFSNTEFFKFNPEPHLAVVIASTAFPFLVSFWLCTSARLANFQFGVLSVTGVLFVMISGFTGITTNPAITDTLGFYFLNLIPVVVGDFVLTQYRTRISMYVVGGIFGSVFLLLYYPYVVYTYNEVLAGMLISPSMIGFAYFDILDTVFAYTLVPAILLGVVAASLSSRLLRGIINAKNLVLDSSS